MFLVPDNETLIETKACKHCGVSFPITDKDLEFYEKVSPTFGNQKYLIPSPTLCPECREQRRLCWRSRRKLYKRRCDATGRDIISMFHPESGYMVYHSKIYESDVFDGRTYGKDFDFTQSFFSQFDALLLEVPLPHLAVVESTLENADYVNGANHVKNSYLSNNIVEVDEVYYCEEVYFSQNCVDSLSLKSSQECYECTDSRDLTACQHLYSCENCSHCSYSQYCKWCTDCVGCFNLTNKQYCIFNIQYSKEEYEEKVQGLTPAILTSEFSKLQHTQPHRSLNIINSHWVSGDNIIDTSNSFGVFDITNSENIRYSTSLSDACDCYDITFWGQGITQCYEGCSVWLGTHRALFCAETYAQSTDCIYSFFCYPNSSNLFGCIGMKGAQYCILNKQYTKEEYEALVPRIIEHMKQTGEWGEYFPGNISPFGYNETAASEHFPLTRDEAHDQGFKWSDYEAPFPKVEKIIPAGKLPISITEIPDDILNWAIECEVTRKPFRIISQELEFYRKHNLPTPHRHPDQRHLDRIKLRNPRKLFERKCDCCGVQIMTSYGPERPEIVYCEFCDGKNVIN